MSASARRGTALPVPTELPKAFAESTWSDNYSQHYERHYKKVTFPILNNVENVEALVRAVERWAAGQISKELETWSTKRSTGLSEEERPRIIVQTDEQNGITRHGTGMIYLCNDFPMPLCRATLEIFTEEYEQDGKHHQQLILSGTIEQERRFNTRIDVSFNGICINLGKMTQKELEKLMEKGKPLEPLGIEDERATRIARSYDHN